MEKHDARRHEVIEQLEHAGGLVPGASRAVSRQTGVPEADIYGVGSFYTLLARPDAGVRVCQGLSCELAGAKEWMAELDAAGVKYEAVSCLGQCDRAPAALSPDLSLQVRGPETALSPDDPELPINLAGADDASYAALARARELGTDAVLDALAESGLQGRGGAGFPAHIKWRAVRDEESAPKYVVVNADESEPGTFKDRETMLRRPHKLIEGAAIAAWLTGADALYFYVRGEFQDAVRALERALEVARPHLDGLEVHIAQGHGAYICGEETALLEALEGRRGMPRLKPPYPTQQGLFGQPTLINNVETLACVPAIVQRGGAWFRALGRTEAGTKLYCLSGHVKHPGVYELPLGVTLTELVEAAGGYVGTPRAFSPGGASSGFLPISLCDTPLDFKGLSQVGSMLGSAGVVVLDDSVDMVLAARNQQVFFEDESCGQCAPCRIGCRIQRQAIDGFLEARDPDRLAHVEDVAWEMEEGSICGLGMIAAKPLTTALEHFPEDFS